MPVLPVPGRSSCSTSSRPPRPASEAGQAPPKEIDPEPIRPAPSRAASDGPARTRTRHDAPRRIHRTDAAQEAPQPPKISPETSPTYIAPKHGTERRNTYPRRGKLFPPPEPQAAEADTTQPGGLYYLIYSISYYLFYSAELLPVQAPPAALLLLYIILILHCYYYLHPTACSTSSTTKTRRATQKIPPTAFFILFRYLFIYSFIILISYCYSSLFILCITLFLPSLITSGVYT